MMAKEFPVEGLALALTLAGLSDLAGREEEESEASDFCFIFRLKSWSFFILALVPTGSLASAGVGKCHWVCWEERW